MDEARDFYVHTLGCPSARARADFTDVWFYGMQITLQDRPDEAKPDQQGDDEQEAACPVPAEQRQPRAQHPGAGDGGEGGGGTQVVTETCTVAQGTGQRRHALDMAIAEFSPAIAADKRQAAGGRARI